jgi:hypothetical protein
MVNFLLVMLGLSIFANAVLLAILKVGASTMQNATQLLKDANQSITYWKLLAQRFENLIFAEETIEAIMNDIDVTAEHPDPAEQAQANKMITNLKRLAEKVKLANGLKTKGSDETN